MKKELTYNDHHITIIGTGHVFIESVKEVDNIITSSQPSIVCVELDPQRYHALMTNEKATFSDMIAHKGVRFAFIASFLSYIQEKVGKEYGIFPGADMLSAIDAAKKVGANIYFIDMDINRTLSALSVMMTFKEKIRMAGGALFALFPLSTSKKEVTFDENGISEVLSEFKKMSPGAYKVLITDRNLAMAHNIISILDSSEKEQKMIVVVGAGHMEGLCTDLEDLYVDKGKEKEANITTRP